MKYFKMLSAEILPRVQSFKYKLIFVILSFVKLAPDYHGLILVMYIDCWGESGSRKGEL